MLVLGEQAGVALEEELQGILLTKHGAEMGRRVPILVLLIDVSTGLNEHLNNSKIATYAGDV